MYLALLYVHRSRAIIVNIKVDTGNRIHCGRRADAVEFVCNGVIMCT